MTVTTPPTSTAPPARRQAPTRVAEVLRTSRLGPHFVRVVLGGDGLAEFAVGEFTDHYVKLLFPPPGAPYGMPVDPGALSDEVAAQFRPLMRSYTVRSWDPAAGELTIDFVVHGDAGVAGPWALAARPGDRISLRGPGGAYAPAPEAAWHLLVGDESALPAIAVAVGRLAPGAVAHAFVEVADAGDEQELTSPADLRVTWVHRQQAGPGGLLAAVRSADLPRGDVHAFVHGEAAMVRDVRRLLRREWGVPLERLSASGYWREGRTDEAWRAEKKAWNAAVEAEETGAAG